MPPAAVSASPPLAPNRVFGRFALRRLLGRSDQTMLWLAVDTQKQAEVMLTLPRSAPDGAGSIGNWLLAARRAARLDHPNLAAVLDSGVHEHWPFVAVDRRLGVTLDEWLTQHPNPSLDEVAVWIGGVLRGLAFAHDAGVTHRDLQSHAILVNERGQAVLMALSVAQPPSDAPARTGARPGPGSAPAPAPAGIDPTSLRAQRAAAELDVLACGLVLHRLLAGAPPMREIDTGRVIARMAPRGREAVRLPWTTPQAIPEPLRAIVDRSTAAQSRLCYRSARTFHAALAGWHEAVAGEDGGPVTLLLDRLRSVGHLPALPGLATRVRGMTRIPSQRTDDIARHLLPDIALSLELLRTVNSAQVQGTQISGNGPVLTVRRVVALIGVDGVRAAANGLRVWPGPLDEEGARALYSALERVRLAGHLAQALRPAGYDAEVVYLVAALQNLGRLLARYHFAEEAEQIDQLMQPLPATPADGNAQEQPGLAPAAAGYAVLGVDIDAFGTAAARHWGLGDDVLHMMRRLPVDVPVRKPDGDTELLRIVASAANEAVDALALPPSKVAAALAAVAQRYARTLSLDGKALQTALGEARDAVRNGGVTPAAAAADAADAPAPSERLSA